MSGNPFSMVDTNVWVSLSLAAANFLMSQVIDMVEVMAPTMADLSVSSKSGSDRSFVTGAVIECAGGGPGCSSVKIAASSSGRVVTSGFLDPAGYREVQSGAQCFLPGM